MAKRNIVLFHVWSISMVVLALALSNSQSTNAAINCQAAVGGLVPCIGYLTGKEPEINGICCSGAKRIDKVVRDSGMVVRKTICECVKAIWTEYAPIIIDRAVLMERTCACRTHYLEVTPDNDCSNV